MDTLLVVWFFANKGVVSPNFGKDAGDNPGNADLWEYFDDA